jgi:hypothetical protein
MVPGEIACPVAALKCWLVAASITEGAVFRRVFNRRNQRVSAARLSASNVAAIVKAGAARTKVEYQCGKTGRRLLRAEMENRSNAIILRPASDR